LDPVSQPEGEKVPITLEELKLVLDEECKIRKSPEFIAETKAYLESHDAPPEQVHSKAQLKALETLGYSTIDQAVKFYQYQVSIMARIFRQEYFFLEANDRHFRTQCALGY